MRRHRTTARGGISLLLLLGLSAGVAAASPGPTQYPGLDGPGRKGVEAARTQQPRPSRPCERRPALSSRSSGGCSTRTISAAAPQGRHEGNDIIAPRGAPGVAIEAGKIGFCTTSANAGCMLYLYGKRGTTYLYIHLNNDVTNGTTTAANASRASVCAGLNDGPGGEGRRVVAFVGDSGDATGLIRTCISRCTPAAAPSIRTST